MTYLLLYFAVFSIGANADLTTLRLLENIDHCKNQSKVDQVLIDQAHEGNFTDDEKLVTYYWCFGKARDRYAGYLKDNPPVRVTLGKSLAFVANWDLLTPKLKKWLVNSLQHNPETVDDAIRTCAKFNWASRLTVRRHRVFEISKCLSEKGVPVDVVSANYVDRSVEDLKKIHDICKNQHDADQNLINEAQNGNVTDSKILGKYYTCYYLNAGFLNMLGYTSYNYLKNWFTSMLKQKSDHVESALDRCYKPEVDKKKLIEEVLQIVKCFADEKLPIDVMAN